MCRVEQRLFLHLRRSISLSRLYTVSRVLKGFRHCFTLTSVIYRSGSGYRLYLTMAYVSNSGWLLTVAVGVMFRTSTFPLLVSKWFWPAAKEMCMSTLNCYWWASWTCVAWIQQRFVLQQRNYYGWAFWNPSHWKYYSHVSTLQSCRAADVVRLSCPLCVQHVHSLLQTGSTVRCRLTMVGSTAC